MKRYKRALTICRNIRNGSGVYNACKAANTSITAFYNWRHDNPKFDKFVQKIFDARTQNVVDALYKGALEGSVPSQIFWLKNKAGWKDSPLVDQSNHLNIEVKRYVYLDSRALKEAKEELGNDSHNRIKTELSAE
jgi:hypothetical protein